MAAGRNRLLGYIVAATLTGAPAAAVHAQQPPQTQQGQISEKEIETFAAAASEVRQLNRQWGPKLDAAMKESAEAAQTLRNQALQEMAQAVERKGMSVERYEQIFLAANSDADVRRRIVEKMPKED
jgi:hypothetical protein